ncbi:hypothetical protein [Streptomyces sp. NBC_00328]|uniref:hypothetical protein n=1 Tax=Streptomyces sp. NBC_00328 TaxID=2903646 RepID=UPI002E2A7CE1|nr:hypothetical protein [Streptomyces sp. NBC_00328]
MTTATTVAGQTLSGWSRDARHGTWHALLPAGSGGPVLGALRIDRALLAPQGTRERLAAAVLAVGRLRLPGVLGTVDLVAEAGEVWLIAARPPAPTLADLLAGGDKGPDAGSAASVLNETAQTLLTLHAAGLAHGTLDADTVILAPDGVALLAEAALGTVLGDTLGGVADSACRAADIAAWAGLARTLGEAWVTPGTPAAAVFARCCAAAGSEGLAAARAALVAGRAALPEGFLRRTELRAAVAAAASGGAAAATAADGTGAGVQRVRPWERESEVPGSDIAGFRAAGSDVAGLEAAGSEGTESKSAESGGADARDAGAGSTGAEDMGPGAGSVVLERGRSRHTVPDEQLTLPGRTRSAPHRPRSTAASDDQATLLGKRNRTPAEATTPPPTGEGEDDGEILLRFGPGIPLEDQDVLRAQWRTAPVPPDRRPRRRRRRAWIATTAFLTAAAVLLWLLLRPSPVPTVTAVEVRAPVGRLHCGQTADLVGVVTTDGRGGPVTYHWLRSDGHDSGELVSTARRGEHRVTVHLRWTVRGPGSFRGTARLRIVHQPGPTEAEATFSYACS